MLNYKIFFKLKTKSTSEEPIDRMPSLKSNEPVKYEEDQVKKCHCWCFDKDTLMLKS
jgi:hypothetical protein